MFVLYERFLKKTFTFSSIYKLFTFAAFEDLESDIKEAKKIPTWEHLLLTGWPVEYLLPVEGKTIAVAKVMWSSQKSSLSF